MDVVADKSDSETSSYDSDFSDFEEDFGDVDLEEDLQALNIDDREELEDLEEGEISPARAAETYRSVDSLYPNRWRNEDAHNNDVQRGNSDDGKRNSGALEEGIVRSEVSVNTKRQRKKKRRRKASESHNLSKFVRFACKRLQEKKLHLMWEAVKKLGRNFMQDLVNETLVIEDLGGQLTADGRRRRTPGGVLWNILRSKVPPEVYKEIMSNACEALKQKHPHCVKRRRDRRDKRGRNKRPRTVYEFDNPNLVQRAWAEGAKAKGSPLLVP